MEVEGEARKRVGRDRRTKEDTQEFSVETMIKSGGGKNQVDSISDDIGPPLDRVDLVVSRLISCLTTRCEGL